MVPEATSVVQKANYSGGNYYVEAEGIYIGYQYYETRYFDSVANASFNPASKKDLQQETLGNIPMKSIIHSDMGSPIFHILKN